ncbi:MAG: DUF488 family protein [Thaumarchaeota archaeon]|jgi:uncharacterized protein (DUF488 family)|nr:DUF488 family protein [Candidatus Geocrenenecus arthurdayi]MCL7390311.1 DUF488 family protein [Candidatus Geocrenenecus arthurdayi]MCL7391013.1 DUF488 family protein [Candidatus Geocrenenecus arthurdayi]MCL7396135.1 DUF488 family protein [Candidatus Geocrenenecus arthurdayi]MCL7403408.1 DUF488 family protein [Candidatus Geocrenenecus arthurdayi]
MDMVVHVYTLGHSNRDLKEFINIIQDYSIQILFDVRRFPSSRFSPHFSYDNLLKTLRKLSIDYVWIKELGGFRKFGEDVEDIGIGKSIKSEGFRAYATYLAINNGAKQALVKLASIAEQKTTVIMCRERFPWRCHRRFISDYLFSRGFQVIHILEVGREIKHKLPRYACLHDGEVVYL